MARRTLAWRVYQCRGGDRAPGGERASVFPSGIADAPFIAELCVYCILYFPVWESQADDPLKWFLGFQSHACDLT